MRLTTCESLKGSENSTKNRRPIPVFTYVGQFSMMTYMQFCMHLERNSINMYLSDACFSQKLEKNENVFVLSTNVVTLKVFKTVKSDGLRTSQLI